MEEEDLTENKQIEPHQEVQDREKDRIQLPQTLSDLDILCTDFPEPNWIVPGILPEGLTILGGKPKAGKSTLSLSLGNSVASGGRVLGQIDVEQRKVLYLALEDNPRRLKPRILKMLNGSNPSSQLHFAFDWFDIDQAGIQMFDNWLRENPETKLVIIDTFIRIRGTKRSGGTLYDADYNAMASIKTIADKHSAAFVVIHHLRKAASDDILDLISGSTGLTAAADTVIIMKRGKGQADAELVITGRDVEDTELALTFDNATKSFSILGQAEEYRMSAERREVLDLLKSSNEAIQLKDIAKTLNKKEPAISNLLSGLIDHGFVEQPGYGKYQIRHEKSEIAETGESSEIAN
ncbi:AAA family ATPase [Desulfobacula sp.]|uniref:AAA family ATPase n=1 Tax=Desulfobacula sp. TaxID=2593537 RepID=UPI001EC8F096|nr:AAA family ATPase [Desulfobacula sp.]